MAPGVHIDRVMETDEFLTEEPTATLPRESTDPRDTACAEWMRLARERAARRDSSTVSA